MKRDALTTVVVLAVLTLVLGLAYPLAVAGVGRVAFPGAAGGSLVRVDGRVVGSRLLGQGFGAARYFHSRPSQTDWNPSQTGFSNAGPNGAETRAANAARAAAYLRVEGRYDRSLTRAAIPPDAVQTSGSGVDPHISPANARIQAHRVAAVRGLALGSVEQLVAQHTDGRGLGLFGEPGVNVLELNLALDKETAR